MDCIMVTNVPVHSAFSGPESGKSLLYLLYVFCERYSVHMHYPIC